MGEEPQAPRDQAAELPADSKPGPRELKVAVDAILLDVVESPAVPERALPGAATERMQAFIRGATGRILVRSPDRERARPEYQLVRQSAKAGETQGEPVEPDATTQPPTGPQRPGDRPPPDQPPGGGGGGGG
jgi:hypothetical protein